LRALREKSNFISNILQQENLKFLNHKPLQGGDINDVFLVEADKGKFVIKVNDTSRFPKMFEAEAKGLLLLKNTKTFKIPEVINFGETENHSYLLLEYITPGTKNINFNKTFGNQLAELHQNTAPYFGLDHDNYIGSLTQKNDGILTNAANFYIKKRLLPQLELAGEKGFSFQDLNNFFKNIQNEIPDEPPALIHGDLWNGNYLVDATGNPCLIDPAVCFASREMDLAMMQLFGGFSDEVFQVYNDAYPLTKNWKIRTDLWQLYYLLVHLNLFGSGYYNQVNTIIRKYS
jgi:fructosamine-3-kinase